jgi:hypothetical protein
MVLYKFRFVGLLLALTAATGILLPAAAGPDLEILLIGKSYVGRAHGAADSTGQNGGVFEGYSFKVGISEALDCDHISIVSGDSSIGEMYILNDGKTGFMTFRRSIPESSFHLYRRQSPPQPESFRTAYLPSWPERKWYWRPESVAQAELRRWKPEDYIGTYVIEKKDTNMPAKAYVIRQVEGDDPD